MSKQDNIVVLQGIEVLETEASEWLMRLEDGDLAPRELAAFCAWRDKSDRHRDAFNSVAALWGDFDMIVGLKDYAAAARETDKTLKRPVSWRMSRRSFAAIAASLVLVAGAGVLFQAVDFGATQQGFFETAVGERKRIELRDGSIIELNTETKVEIAFTKTARDVRLLRGEAHFDVVSNARKPFSVYAYEGVVTAIGTEFTVRLREALVDVIVTEGRVALAAMPEADSPRKAGEKPVVEADMVDITELSAGQNALFNKTVERLDVVESAVIERKLSWREGLLSFSGEPLGEVIADMSRYTDLSIEIEDEALRALPVAGFFKIGEMEAMFDALEIMIDVRVERIDDAHVRIVRSDSRAQTKE